jgi:hypothetical protein
MHWWVILKIILVVNIVFYDLAALYAEALQHFSVHCPYPEDGLAVHIKMLSMCNILD